MKETSTATNLYPFPSQRVDDLKQLLRKGYGSEPFHLLDSRTDFNELLEGLSAREMQDPGLLMEVNAAIANAIECGFLAAVQNKHGQYATGASSYMRSALQLIRKFDISEDQVDQIVEVEYQKALGVIHTRQEVGQAFWQASGEEGERLLKMQKELLLTNLKSKL